MTQGTASKLKMSPTDLIACFTEEVQHHVINDECTKAAKLVLMAHGKNCSKSSGMGWKKNAAPNLDAQCDNCQRLGHIKVNCWSKGGGKEGQGLGHRKPKIKNPTESATVADSKSTNEDLFAFTCTSDFSTSANATAVPKSWYQQWSK